MTPTTITPPAVDLDGLDPADPRATFASVVGLAGAVLSTVEPDQLDTTTACAEFTVRDLCGHMISVLHRVAGVARDEDPFAFPLVAAVDDGALVAAWNGAARDVEQAWSDPTILGRDLTLPFGVMPGAAALAVYHAEFTVHTWDLATAIGARVAYDDAIVEMCEAVVRDGVPAESRGPEMPFDPIVELVEGAPPIERLVAWLGRRPPSAVR